MALAFLATLLVAIPLVQAYPTAFMDFDKDGSKNQTSIRFLALGDWGGVPLPPYITPVERATAQAMGRVAQQMGADFILALGDNFYYRGVDSVDSPRFQDTFERVFTAESLNVPWYVLAGNHDHAGNVRAQMEYSRKSDRWRFPYYYYELNFRIPNTEKTLSIIMLDTVMLCGNSDDYADERPRGALNAGDANRQLVWLRERMAKSQADFLVVAGHYPVWSVSEHGPTECLLKFVRPLLVKHKATAYFCGHDHNLQFIKEGGVGYVVSGAGNFLDPDIRHWDRVPRDAIKFFTGQASTLGGFVHAEVSEDKMVLTFIEARGTSLYHTVIPRRDVDKS